jgi:hypothetical protein
MKKYMLLLSYLFMYVALQSCSKSEYNLFATLYGVVTDHATGEPIANASVVLSPGGKTQTTGSDGTFLFDDLDPQQYTVTVQKTGYQTNRKTVTAVSGGQVEVNIPLTQSQ